MHHKTRELNGIARLKMIHVAFTSNHVGLRGENYRKRNVIGDYYMMGFLSVDIKLKLEIIDFEDHTRST